MAALTADMKAQLRQVMDERCRLLLGEIRDELASSEDQHYIDLAGRVTDLGDESVASMLADLDAALVDRQIAEVREIDTALKRIESESFGLCVDCGGDIAFERLQAYPTAQRCLACQAVYEKTYAHEGKPSI